MASIPAKKSLGQHFLTNTYVAKDIADAAEIVPGENVLEVGPGTGMLTRELLEQKARTIAVEADLRAVAVLSDTFTTDIDAGVLTVHHADIRTTPLNTFGVAGGAYKVVANIPYYLSGMLFRLFLSSETQPSLIVFLVQKEVAERIARSKKESLLSLSVKAYGHPEYLQTVSRGNFRPAPKVDSAVLRISGISRKRFTDLDESFFFKLLTVGFSARRKQLLGNLEKIAPREMLKETFEELAISPKVRGEDLSIDTWIALATALAHRLSTQEK